MMRAAVQSAGAVNDAGGSPTDTGEHITLSKDASTGLGTRKRSASPLEAPMRAAVPRSGAMSVGAPRETKVLHAHGPAVVAGCLVAVYALAVSGTMAPSKTPAGSFPPCPLPRCELRPLTIRLPPPAEPDALTLDAHRRALFSEASARCTTRALLGPDAHPVLPYAQAPSIVACLARELQEAAVCRSASEPELNRVAELCFRLARDLEPGHATKALRGRGAVRRFLGCVLAPGLECASELSEL